MPLLQRLIYRSEATGRTDSLLNVATILGEAQRNNARRGLTGALAAHDGRFLQVIEGDAGTLDILLKHLAADPRHRHIEVLARDDASERRFEGWSMASATVDPETAPALDRLMSETAPCPDAIVDLLKAAIQPAMA